MDCKFEERWRFYNSFSTSPTGVWRQFPIILVLHLRVSVSVCSVEGLFAFIRRLLYNLPSTSALLGTTSMDMMSSDVTWHLVFHRLRSGALARYFYLQFWTMPFFFRRCALVTRFMS